MGVESSPVSDRRRPRDGRPGHVPGSDASEPPMGGGAVKFYADIHRTKKSGEGFRITYTTDGTTFKHTDCFDEIPAGPGDKLFMDTIPPQHTDGAIELLRRGVEVYYLRRLTLLEKIRKEHKLPKSARGDIRALMSIEEGWFRRVT